MTHVPNAHIDQIYHFVKGCRLQQQRRVFQIPFHLKEAGVSAAPYKSVAELDQVIFDLRTPQEREFVRLSKNTTSFKLEFDLWRDRPQLITSETVEVERGSWSPTVHHLERQGQILHITVDRKMTAFTFYTAREPFARLQRILVRKKGFNCAMLVPDMRP